MSKQGRTGQKRDKGVNAQTSAEIPRGRPVTKCHSATESANSSSRPCVFLNYLHIFMTVTILHTHSLCKVHHMSHLYTGFFFWSPLSPLSSFFFFSQNGPISRFLYFLPPSVMDTFLGEYTWSTLYMAAWYSG